VNATVEISVLVREGEVKLTVRREGSYVVDALSNGGLRSAGNVAPADARLSTEALEPFGVGQPKHRHWCQIQSGCSIGTEL
jgi:hypothetical protein